MAARGTWAGLALSYFAPLPLMIATFGYGLAVGGAAVLTGGLIAGLLATPVAGLAVGAGLLLPSFLICVAALRAPATPPDDRRASRIVMVAVVFAAATAAALLVSLVTTYGGLAAARQTVVTAVLPTVRAMIEESRLPAGFTSEELTRALVGLAPAAVAGSTFFMLAINAWIAGRIALFSGQLSQPWPLIADTLALPGLAAGLFAVACGLVFLGGLPGAVASIVAATLGCGFALVGLAVIHATSRGLQLRSAILAGLYVVIVCLPPWPLILLAAVGLVDTAFHLRRRRADALSKPPTSRS